MTQSGGCHESQSRVTVCFRVSVTVSLQPLTRSSGFQARAAGHAGPVASAAAAATQLLFWASLTQAWIRRRSRPEPGRDASHESLRRSHAAAVLGRPGPGLSVVTAGPNGMARPGDSRD